MPRRRAAGEAILSLLAGVLLALLSWMALRQLTAVSLGKLVAPERSTPNWTVALIFRAKECPSQMAVIETLNRLEDPRIRIQGLLLVEEREFGDWRDLVRAYHIDFPVRTTSPGAAGRALGGTPTPALAVYDPRGRLRLLTNFTDPRLTTEIIAQVISLATRSPEGG